MNDGSWAVRWRSRRPARAPVTGRVGAPVDRGAPAVEEAPPLPAAAPAAGPPPSAVAPPEPADPVGDALLLAVLAGGGLAGGVGGG
jgi:hypothetical protein